MIDYYETKSQPITRVMVLQAYKRVRANKGNGGIDSMNWEDFDKQRNPLLFKLWNRMTSSSYFPMPVKEVSIPKSGGGRIYSVFRSFDLSCLITVAVNPWITTTPTFYGVYCSCN